MRPLSPAAVAELERKLKVVARDSTGYVPRADFVAVLRMLIRRATLTDRWLARRRRGHWLNKARREVLIP